MSYIHAKLKSEYGEKLKELAEREHRTMTNMLEVLIDQEYRKSTQKFPEAPGMARKPNGASEK